MQCVIYQQKDNQCHLRIKSEPFLSDLKFKSEHLINHNLKPKEEVLGYGTVAQEIHRQSG
jgi:hypothetical protein